MTTRKEPVVLPRTPGFRFAIQQEPGSYRLRVGKAAGGGPAPIDLIVRKVVVLKGVYALSGDELKLCVVNRLACEDRDDRAMAKAADGKGRPAGFETKAG